MVDGKDELVTLGTNQTNPYDAKASEFKAGGPSVGAEGAGMSEQDKMVMLSETQEGPRHNEDEGKGKGYGTPTPTDRSAKVSAGFKEMKNSNEGGTSLSLEHGVDFGSGKWHSGLDYKN